MKTWTCTIAAACVGFTTLAAPVMAQPIVRESRAVSYAGLDLNTPEGQKLLEQRAESAARAVCAYNEPVTGSRMRQEARACFAKARATAREKVAAVIEDHRRGG